MSQQPALLSLSVLFNGDRVLSLPPLAPTIDVATIKMLIGTETNVSAGSIVLLYKQSVLTDAQTLGGIGVKTDEMLEARAGAANPVAARPVAAAAAASGATQQRPPASAAPVRPGSGNFALGMNEATFTNPLAARDFLRANPEILFSIEAQNPPLYQAIMMNDLPQFSQMWKGVVENVQANIRREREMNELQNADPMDPAVQARIAEEIRLKNVQENYEMAIEHAPETFGRVIMLYIPMSVNGHKLQAFVDSGAQSTIMSVQCAERVGIMRLIDTRFAGIAKGVGSAKILGRVHQVPCTIGSVHLAMSFTILENQGMDFLLGLDQLKKQLASIDLSKNALVIHGQEIPFLSEKDLPQHARGGGEAEDDEPMTSPPAAAATSSSSSSHRPTPAAAGMSGSATPQQLPAAAAAVAAALRRAAEAQATTSTPAAATTTRPTVPVAAIPAPAATSYMPTPAQIAQLTDLGFSANESRQALIRFNGNVDEAAGFLFAS